MHRAYVILTVAGVSCALNCVVTAGAAVVFGPGLALR